MIIIFSAVVFAISLAYWLISQYTGSAAVPIFYAAAVILICVFYFMIEKRKRRRIIKRADELFDGKFSDVTIDDELSPLERKIVRSMKSSSAMEAKVRDGYKKIAELVSDISHQCKTPLSSVLLYSEMPPGDANSEAIHAQAQKLSFLINALTKLSRCEGGLIDENLRPAECSIEKLICESVNSVISAARVKNIEITCDIPDDFKVRCDFRWTAEAIFNLLDNAVKYSPAGSQISVSTRKYDMFARIDVADRGTGIPEDELAKVWKRFYRGKGTSDIVGVGIGLYLARLILSGEGGKISVDSKPGRGSTFSVFLPRM